MFIRAIALLSSILAASALPGAEPPAKPKLVVLVVFDQMRGDYLERWQPLYGTDGFEKMKRDGAWYSNCHYPYATTVTGAGHASLLTGTCPDHHGIIGNAWYDRASRATVNCSTTNRYDRVPALSPLVVPEKAADGSDEDGKARGFPGRLLAPSVGDVLKDETHNAARLVGLSFKDRGAVLPIGKRSDAAYWLDGEDGMMITSTYYRTTPHSWIDEVNRQRHADRWFDKPWTRLRQDVNYAMYSGIDEGPGEGIGTRQGTTFPHPMTGGKDRITKSYFNALFNSPYGNEFLLEVVKAAIVGEKLGQRDVSDLLAVSFSSNDAIGHCWGPDSQEVMDVTLRSDRIMADFIKFLDANVGAGNYLIALTADHGICPLPEASAAKGLDARRITSRELFGDLEGHLTKQFGAIPAKTRWIEAVSQPWLYLNQDLIASHKLKSEEVEKAVADYLKDRPGVLKVYTRTQLTKDDFKTDEMGLMVKRSFHPDRAGDVNFVLKPYYLAGSQLTGTTHGSPHKYDTHVPLLVYGWGVQPGNRKELARPQQIASIFAKALGISLPKDAEFGVPAGLFK